MKDCDNCRNLSRQYHRAAKARFAARPLPMSVERNHFDVGCFESRFGNHDGKYLIGLFLA